MAGIIVGTLLTLLLLPAPYVAWFRMQPVHEDPSPTHESASSLLEASSPEMISVPEPVPVLETQIQQ
jgi:hypothetical protein